MRPGPTGKNGTTGNGKNGDPQSRIRSRGAIRTHLGRKRSGGRTRGFKLSAQSAFGAMGAADRRRHEELFDLVMSRFQEAFEAAGERTLESLERSLESACDDLVNAGEITADTCERLREYIRRDLLQRENPALTFRTGDITSAGTLVCVGCGFTFHNARTTVLPPCPQCHVTVYRKTA